MALINEAAEATLYKDMKLGETAKMWNLYYVCYSEKDSYTIILLKDLNVGS
jgi:hypothetical protein